jgi:hypothetical protein
VLGLWNSIKRRALCCTSEGGHETERSKARVWGAVAGDPSRCAEA